MLCRGIAVKDPEHDTLRAAGSLTNITDRKLAEEQLRFEAMHDSLTGLANRSLLADRLSHSLARNNRDPQHRFALLYIDLDEFKVINDSLGHQVGDKLLIEVARRLAACARKVDTIARIPGDHVARIGGDEFVMLLEDLAAPEDALRVADRIHAALAEPFGLGAPRSGRPGSIGIATSDAGYSRPEEVLRDADTALYQAKQAGKGCTCMFDPQMHQRAMARWSTETELRRAIDRDEFELHYQPIVDRRRAARRAGGAGALASPYARAGDAQRLHLHRRGDRPHRAAREAGVGQGLPAAATVAARNPVAGTDGGGGEHLSPAVRLTRRGG